MKGVEATPLESNVIIIREKVGLLEEERGGRLNMQGKRKKESKGRKYKNTNNKFY